MSGPDTGPCKHGLTSVLDLGGNHELLLGEHAGEGIKGFTFAQLGKAHGVPDSFSVQASGLGRRNLLGDKGRSACHDGSKDSDGELGHGGNRYYITENGYYRIFFVRRRRNAYPFASVKICLQSTSDSIDSIKATYDHNSFPVPISKSRVAFAEIPRNAKDFLPFAL
jgi:hypothetical protein